jgi:hypothetical protein
MRFLVDQCLSVEFAQVLADAGHDVTHLRDLGMQRAMAGTSSPNEGAIASTVTPPRPGRSLSPANPATRWLPVR